MNHHSSSWPEVALGEICELRYGKSLPEEKRLDGSIPVYGSNGIVGQHNDALTDGATIVIGRKGSFGEVHFSPQPCWPIDTTYFIDQSATNADLRWLSYRLKGLGLNRLNKAAAIPGLNRDDAYRQRLKLPPLTEQRRIAEILDRVEALRATRRITLTQLDSLNESIFLALFGDPTTNPKRWPRIALQECTSTIQIGPFGSLLHQEDYISGGIALVNPKHIRKGRIVPSDTETVTLRKFQDLKIFHLQVGDVIMGRRGEMGRCAIVEREEPLLCGTGSLFLRPDHKQTESLFLCAMLSSKALKHTLERLSLGQTLQISILGSWNSFLFRFLPLLYSANSPIRLGSSKS